VLMEVDAWQACLLDRLRENFRRREGERPRCADIFPLGPAPTFDSREGSQARLTSGVDLPPDRARPLPYSCFPTTFAHQTHGTGKAQVRFLRARVPYSWLRKGFAPRMASTLPQPKPGWPLNQNGLRCLDDTGRDRAARRASSMDALRGQSDAVFRRQLAAQDGHRRYGGSLWPNLHNHWHVSPAGIHIAAIAPNLDCRSRRYRLYSGSPYTARSRERTRRIICRIGLYSGREETGVVGSHGPPTNFGRRGRRESRPIVQRSLK